MNYYIVGLLLIIFIVFILWYINRKINGETHYFDKYAKLNHYQPCKYNKYDCIDILDKSRKYGSKYDIHDICIVTVSIGEREFSKINKQRMIKYCDLYGYDMMYFTEIIDKKYPIMWQKCVAIDKALNVKDEYGRYKYKIVAWFDDDIYMTNMKYRIEDFLNINPEKDIFMPRDNIKNNYNHYINAGNYILKNTKVSRDFMKDTLNGMTDLFNGHFTDNMNHEQSINTYLYFSKSKYSNAIEVLPYGVLQSFNQINYELYDSFRLFIEPFFSINKPWEYKDYCIHFASLDQDARYKLCKQIDLVDREITDKNIAYPHTYHLTGKYW